MDDYVIQGNMSALGNILCMMKFFLAIVVDLIEKHRVTSGAYSSEYSLTSHEDSRVIFHDRFSKPV